MTAVTRAANLPKIADPAWHGPIGEAICQIAPITEADPVAILASTLALFGALIGDSPHVMVGGQPHAGRIWPLIIGKTGSGRKGTSFSDARTFVRGWSSYAENYVTQRVVGGLSSGEGLISALSPTPAAAAGEDRTAALAPDGRLTVKESEFVRVLTSAKREHSTLGPVLRQLWDEGSAAILTKQQVTVDNAHLVIITHISARELQLRLAESDLVGGTLNRFLPIASARPHLRPHDMVYPDLSTWNRFLGEAVEAARFQHRLRRDRAAENLWTDVYTALSEDEPDGPLGAVLARGPAYTMRLALIYALADQAGAIACDHLLAALAVWHYAAETARLVFGADRRLGEVERLAAYIAAAGGGRTRTELAAWSSRNKSAKELDELLAPLVDAGDVTSETSSSAGEAGGRPVTRYWWTGVARDAVGELLDRNRP